MDFFKYLDPLRYFTQEQYTSFWGHLFGTVLAGFWARLISVCFLGLAFWFMVRRQNVQAFIIFFFLALATAYMSGLWAVFK